MILFPLNAGPLENTVIPSPPAYPYINATFYYDGPIVNNPLPNYELSELLVPKLKIANPSLALGLSYVK